MNLINLTMTKALQKLRAREITATELTTAYLAQIDTHNAELNAYITVTRERALTDAAESDRRYADGTARELEGIPIGMKDNFATRGIRTTAASKMLENFVSEYESTVSQKLADAGCVLLGKLNMDEFAMYGDGTTSYFGAAKNPIDKTRTPGGSSSGSAAAVAGGLAMAATGTDTGDSIRVPAAFTGIVGMKPTYGLCSRFGCIPFASSLDHAGPITKTVDDAALMLSVMAGHDPRDSTSAPAADEIAKSLAMPLTDLPIAGLRIGIIRELDAPEISTDMRNVFNAAIEKLKSGGVEIIEISIPHIMHSQTLYNIISRAEASSNLSRYDGMRYGLRVDGADLDDTYKKTRAAGFGDNVKMRLLSGAITLTKDFYDDCFLAAARVRRISDNEMTAAFEKCDLIITPATTRTAPKFGTTATDAEDKIAAAIAIPANMSGLPACVVPAGDADGLPLGIQIIGRRFDDVRVLQLAKIIESTGE
ncbi:MAG: Asp-tRNA(Asn)/Glu-tRNA(Gln) amidotransferase subunit GatA [Alphaproteobacteria bacterium]|nr:Asp-tRNA(Asn)/Glu-tRNA(Gln) amidotransferase subunit GatA [Alphaproteobacteria bacterium]MCL2890027.1 Asp-tRNA(Asn)/Glu-tRNA(Gln) amidotransferase subunit GatA [Alphaproteobacteria bacterium]